MSKLLLIAAASYLLGSIPFGYLLIRIFHGEDVRESGSGNIGATNVSRKSPVLGGLTLLLDALKGSASVGLAYYLSNRGTIEFRYEAMSIAAFFAVAGHVFPVWLKLRGGKGVATGLGSFVVIAPKAVLFAALVFVAVVAISRRVSLGSIVGVACFPLLAYEFGEYGDVANALALMSVTSLLIVAKHHENIQRLLAGTESRIGSKPA
jgi:acyl phosphate:glycerol-3-phosphate acyltransferase